jgi:hypothetical protein
VTAITERLSGLPSDGSEDLVVLHAVHVGDRLWLWGESGSNLAASDGGGEGRHGFALDGASILEALDRAGIGLPDVTGEDATDVRVVLPAIGSEPLPSSQLALGTGRGALPEDAEPGVAEFTVPAVGLAPESWAGFFARLQERDDDAGGVVIGPGVRYFELLHALGLHLLSQQRFVPMMRQDGNGSLTAVWTPWMNDEATSEKVSAVLRAMPAAARSAVDEREHDAWGVTEAFLSQLCDSVCRAALTRESMFETVEGRDAVADAQVAWMQGLLGPNSIVPSPPSQRTDVARRVRRWIGSLEDRGLSSSWRLLLRLNEPLDEGLDANIDDPRGVAARFAPRAAAGRTRAGEPVLPPLERALDETEPIEVMLETKEAYTFLREIKPDPARVGLLGRDPRWWDSPVGRLGARLRIESEDMDFQDPARAPTAAGPKLGLTSLVGYHWDIAVGGTDAHAQRVRAARQPEVPARPHRRAVGRDPPRGRRGGRRVHPHQPGRRDGAGRGPAHGVRRRREEDRAARPGRRSDGLGLVHAGRRQGRGGNPIRTTLPDSSAPENFQGTLRPYQARGLSWMAFLEQFGFGCCLADDMGLGKTVQLLALLTHERQAAGDRRDRQAHAAHRPDVGRGQLAQGSQAVRARAQGDDPPRPGAQAGRRARRGRPNHDCVITTFALANRDRETLERVHWGGSWSTRRSSSRTPRPSSRGDPLAQRRPADRADGHARREPPQRALVDHGVPEPRLPRAPSGEFRKRFSQPIERYRDQTAQRAAPRAGPPVHPAPDQDRPDGRGRPAREARDPRVHAPDERAGGAVRELRQPDAPRGGETEGIHRRGLVLAALIKLKQICNHPAQMLKEPVGEGGGTRQPRPRSGKCTRLMEMVDEVLARASAA